MKAVNWLLDKIVLPILLIVLTPIITVVASKASTDSWSELFVATPVLVWVILAVLFVSWTIAAVRYRIKQLREENWSPLPLRFAPYGGWEHRGTCEYAGVIWNVRIPADSSTFGTRRRLTPQDLDVEIPPRCPRCRTELEQTKSFLGGYVWRCVKCGFHKRDRDGNDRQADRVGRIVRSDPERYLSEAEDRQ